jgi:hypothetical protein
MIDLESQLGCEKVGLMGLMNTILQLPQCDNLDSSLTPWNGSLAEG